MSILERSIIPIIEAMYDSLTDTEKLIADFFIQNHDHQFDYAAKHIAQQLHVSVSSLTRFAKKCGFDGYRDFIFNYRESRSSTFTEHGDIIKRVLTDYAEIVNKTFTLIDGAQLERIAKLFAEASRVYIYGIGSSGFAAQDTKYRFMRLGLIIEAITDSEVIAMNQVVLDQDCLVIGFSVSAKTKVVMEALYQAQAKGVKTMLFTANAKPVNHEQFAEIINCASVDNLALGNRISPQLSILIVVDVIYSYFMELDRQHTGSLFKRTLRALDKGSDLNNE